MREYTSGPREPRARGGKGIPRVMPAEYDILADELIRAVEILGDTFAARSTRYAIVGGLGNSAARPASIHTGR